MSNVIPPLLSDSPPPMVNVLDEDEDDFGDFTAAHDNLYNYDDLSLPATPHHIKQVETKDVNSNTNNVENYAIEEMFIPNNVHMDKDFQDKRKNSDNSVKLSETEVNSNQSPVNSVNIVDKEVISDENSSAKLEVTFVPMDLDRIGETIEKPVDNCAVPEVINEFSSNKLSVDIISIENDCGITTLEETKQENDADDFYYCEEPPDLNTVDDRKLNVEDFDYNAYNSEEEFDEIYNSVTEDVEIRQEIASNVIIDADIKQMNDEKLDNTNTIGINEIVGENSQKTNEAVEVIDENVDKNVEDTTNVEIFNDLNAECDLKDCSIENTEVASDSQNISSDSNNFSIEDDDFGDFVTPNVETIDKSPEIDDSPTKKQEISFENQIETPNLSNDDFSNVTQTNEDDDDDFGDFAEADDDNFGDFADFKQSGFSEGQNFGNFGDFTQTFDTKSEIVSAKDMYEHAKKILKEVFPPFDVNYRDHDMVEYLGFGVVFNKIKNITETNALRYQWAKSNGQEKLLRSLNIDTRNILYGPGWNPTMPKFAANVGVTPLEPIKSDILIPTPVHNLSPNVSQPTQSTLNVGTIQTEVPTAQFDWSGSGLVNPLDSLPQETQQKITDRLTIADQVDHPSELPTSDDRSPKQSDTESVKSLQLSTHEENTTKSDANTTNNDEFDDFSSYQPSNNSWIAVNNIPLRETHISTVEGSEIKKFEFEIRKSESGTKKPESETRRLESETRRPESETKKPELGTRKPESETRKPESETKKPEWDTRRLESETKKSDPFDMFVLRTETSKKVMGVSEDDDEFTEFQAGLPSTIEDRLGSVNNQPILQPTAVFEPLKPTILPQANQNTASAQILWPDPGVMDLDILNIDLSYSRKIDIEVRSTVEEPNKPPIPIEVKKVVPPSKNTGFSNVVKSKTITKNDFKIPMNNFGFQNSFGDNKNIGRLGNVDDEWSDFVCNSEPLKPAKIPEKERTNTPELQLSINHLSQLQAPKKPIPVITPHGLLQTKIPSNSNLKNHQPFQTQNPNRSYQPSIISQQYQNHMNGPTFPKIPQVFPQQQQQHAAKLHENIESNNDDDDWTEFVSSAPVSQNRNPKPNGWTNTVMPNIITNPVHSFGSYLPQAANRRNVVPSISSMPELEFSAPKGRGYVKK